MAKVRPPQKATHAKSKKPTAPAKKRAPAKRRAKRDPEMDAFLGDVAQELVDQADTAETPENVRRRGRAGLTLQRVAYIAKRMRDLTFVRGKTGPELAKKWKLSEARLKELTAEASAIVREEVCDPDLVQTDISVALRKVLSKAINAHDWKAATAAAKVWAQVSGAMAPVRVSVKEEPVGDMTDEELEQLVDDATAIVAARKKAA